MSENENYEATVVSGMVSGVIFMEEGSERARIETDDGNVHENVDWFTGPLFEIKNGDRIDWHLRAEDGVIFAYDIVPEGYNLNSV